jgi:hypothetical protein
MTRATLACRVIPDRIGRRRVSYLTGWTASGPGWTYQPGRADVLRGSDEDAAQWREELRRQGIEAQIIREGS